MNQQQIIESEKSILNDKGIKLDIGKVTLLTILSMNEKQRDKTKQELIDLKKLVENYDDFQVLGQFAYDMGLRETMTSKQIAKELNNWGFIDD